MNPGEYDIIMAQINTALNVEEGKTPDIPKIKSIIQSTDCPYLLSMIKNRLAETSHQDLLS